MKALVYKGPCEISMENVVDPWIERPTDVLVRITRTNICGSELHMYENQADIELGRVLGHENLGEVIKAGERSCLPFNIASSFCKKLRAQPHQLLHHRQPEPGYRRLRLRRHEALQQRTSPAASGELR